MRFPVFLLVSVTAIIGMVLLWYGVRNSIIFVYFGLASTAAIIDHVVLDKKPSFEKQAKELELDLLFLGMYQMEEEPE
jgi:hypothetical protein